MVLDQQGTSVTGTYQPGNGQIQGELNGSVLRGTWSQPVAQDGFLFAIAEDGHTFTGRYDNGEFWNGERQSEDLAARRHFTASFMPRETLRTVLAAANAAAFERDAAAARFFEPLLIYEGSEDDARDRNRQRRLLFQIINLSTFRLINAPGRVDGNEATFAIRPIDSDVRYTLRFRLGEDGIWRILVEQTEVLRGALKRLHESLEVSSEVEALERRRHNPRQTMFDFLNGMSHWNNGSNQRALDTLDLSYLPLHLRSIEGPIIADYLRQIIDRIGFVIWQEIPNDPDMPVPHVHYSHPNGSVTIERQPAEEGKPAQWRFSAATLQAAPALYTAIQNMPLAPGLDEPKPVTQFFQLREMIRGVSPWLLKRNLLFENWQWGALVASLAVSLLMGHLAGLILKGMLAVGATKENADIRRDTKRQLLWPLRRAAGIFTVLVLLANLGLLHTGLGFGARVVGLVSAITVTVLVYQVISAVGAFFYRRAEKTPGYLDEIVVSLTNGLLKLLAVIFGILRQRMWSAYRTKVLLQAWASVVSPSPLPRAIPSPTCSAARS